MIFSVINIFRVVSISFKANALMQVLQMPMNRKPSILGLGLMFVSCIAFARFAFC